jgi:outer membrane protein assembly factor BamA
LRSNLSPILFKLLLSVFLLSPFCSLATSDDTSTVFIKEILIIGNKKTKSSIILRELPFSRNDTVNNLDSVLVRCKENLMNIGLFNFVDINYIKEDPTTVIVYISVSERWYLWPMPVFELADRNFNEWAQNKDLSRTNYGLNVRQDNFRGRDEILQLQFVYGYSHRLGINYTVPYINRKQNIGLSAGFLISQYHEITYDVVGDKLQFYKNEDLYVRKDFSSYVRINKRKGIYNYFITGLDYRRNSTIDSVLMLNPSYFVNQSTYQQALTLSWGYRFDKRDYQPYALKGTYFEFDVFRSGFAALKNEPEIMAISTGIRKYYKLNDKFHFAAMAKGRLTQRSKAPFFNQRAIGYGQDYIRGYDYYVMNGQNYLLMKSQFKYTLMKRRVYRTSFINSDKFNQIPVAMYINLFADGGYVQDRFYSQFNNLSNKFQYSYGIGFDYVTYYDLVFRFEYAFNRMKESGFFFRIGAAF